MANVLVGHRVIRAFEVEVGTAISFDVAANQLIQIIDLEGQQVAGFVAFGGENRQERLSTSTTMTANASIVIKKGDNLYGTERTPLFEVMDDSVGRHDMLTGPLPAPDAATTNATVQPTSRDALKAAANEVGLENADISDPINWFKHVVIKQRGELEVKESFSERNDTLVLRALTDAVVIISNSYHERRPGVTAGKAATDKRGVLLVRAYR